MEEIYEPSYFNATEHINIKEYFDSYKQELFEEQTSDISVDAKIESFLKGYTKKYLAEINEQINIDNLTVPNEQDPSSMENFINVKYTCPYTHKPGIITPESRSLCTVSSVENRKRIGDRKLFLEIHNRSMDVYDNRPPTVGEPDLKPGQEIVITIRFFSTFSYKFSEKLPDDTFTFDQEIIMLGSQSLTDLRDVIKCMSDMAVLTDVSENPSQRQNLELTKERYPSGFFFIDDVFYNDLRSKRAIDYSEVIRNWAKEQEVGEFESRDMKDIQLMSLSPRFGYPYMYQHLGECEHVFIFSYAKLLTVSDPLHLSSYPYQSDSDNTKGLMCYFCGERLPVFVVVDCDRLPNNNSLLCNECFSSYLYLDNKKIGSFKAYPYAVKSSLF